MIDRYRWRSVRREARVVVGLVVAVAASGCSLTLPSIGEDSPDSTGSIARANDASPLSPDLGQEDWRRARSALAVALDPQGSGSAVKWDNPDTEVHGTFTPVAQPFVKANEVCRAFLASIVFPARTVSLQGTGCRVVGEEWRLEGVRPWQKSA